MNSNENIDNESCEMCGGKLVLDPVIGQVKCSFCGSIKAIRKTTEQVEKFKILHMENYRYDWEIEEEVVVCQNCGGKTITPKNAMSTRCIFCDSSMILHNETNDLGLRPNSIIPFKLNQDKAIKLLEAWLEKEKKLKYAHIPRQTILRNQFSAIKGVYVPYWSFDTTARVTWHKHYEQDDTGSLVSLNEEHESGTFSDDHEDRLVVAVKSKFGAYLEDVSHYDFIQLEDYKPEYLAGFYAQKYNVKPEDALTEALSGIYTDYEDKGYRETQNTWSFIDFDHMKFALFLLPVYFTSFWYKKDLYFVVINGQTGYISGGLATRASKKRRRKKYIMTGSLLTIAIIIVYLVVQFLMDMNARGIMNARNELITTVIALFIGAVIMVIRRGYI